jgi:hypothetical protein
MFKRVLWIFILSMRTTIGWAKGDILPDTTANDSSQIELIGGRYVFMQSGFPVEKRTLQYQNLNALVNDIQYGITDEITLAGGLFLPFYAYIAPQYSVEVAKNRRLVVGDILTSSLFFGRRFFIESELDLRWLYHRKHTQPCNISHGVFVHQSFARRVTGVSVWGM